MIMNRTATVLLPGGLWADGVCHREASLRPLNGEDEVFLLDSGDLLLPAERTTALLARCLTCLEGLDRTAQPPEALPRALTVGDREALLLHLRRLSVGERMACVLHCPVPDCGQPMDLDLRVTDLLLPPYAEVRPEHEATLGDDGTAVHVRFRLPTGADQEAAAVLAVTDPEAATDLLLRRCLLQLAVGDGPTMAISPDSDLPDVVRRDLPSLLARLDPQAELLLNLACPVCGQAFTALFDAAAYLFQEVSERAAHLYREVHLLAFYYHWSEAEILGMTATKRQRYLDLLAEALAEGERR
jgi:hypothetical protein